MLSRSTSVREDVGQVQVCAVLLNVIRLETQLNVTLTTIDGTAIAGSDYVSRSLDTFFPAGSRRDSQHCINIPIIDDSVAELREEFTVILTATLSLFSQPVRNNDSTIVILDNEGWQHHRYIIIML